MPQKGDDECQVRSQVGYLAASSLVFFSLSNKTTKKIPAIYIFGIHRLRSYNLAQRMKTLVCTAACAGDHIHQTRTLMLPAVRKLQMYNGALQIEDFPSHLPNSV